MTRWTNPLLLLVLLALIANLVAGGLGGGSPAGGGSVMPIRWPDAALGLAIATGLFVHAAGLRGVRGGAAEGTGSIRFWLRLSLLASLGILLVLAVDGALGLNLAFRDASRARIAAGLVVYCVPPGLTAMGARRKYGRERHAHTPFLPEPSGARRARPPPA